MSTSEIAALRKDIDAICNSMYQGLHGYAQTGRHAIITHRYEMLGEKQEQLATHVGKDEAFQEILAAMRRNEEYSEIATP